MWTNRKDLTSKKRTNQLKMVMRKPKSLHMWEKTKNILMSMKRVKSQNTWPKKKKKHQDKKKKQNKNLINNNRNHTIKKNIKNPKSSTTKSPEWVRNRVAISKKKIVSFAQRQFVREIIFGLVIVVISLCT